MSKDIKDTRNTAPTRKSLIKQIADALPVDIRTDFYEEMLYMESLPESDEMLRIIHVMGFLTLLTEQVPGRVTTEREHFERICREVVETAKRLETTGGRYYQELYKRLTQLPADIANGINPRTIAERINDSLKKQFDMSTIPIISIELAANAERIKATAVEFARASDDLSDSWSSSASKAKRAIEEINTAVTKAVASSEQAAEKFITSFNSTYRWILVMTCTLLLFMGFFCGILYWERLTSTSGRQAASGNALPKAQTETKPSTPPVKKK